MLFDTTVPKINSYTAPIDPRGDFHGNLLTKLAGYSDNGKLNTWGQILPYTPFGGAASIGGGLAMKNYAAGTKAEDNVNASAKTEMARSMALGQLALGVGATAAGAPQAGVPMIASGTTQLGQTYMKEGTGFHGLPGGSHESGNDLELVHSQSKAPTGIKMSGREVLVGEENSDALREAIKKGDKKAVWNIMSAQMSEKPKKYDGEVKLEDGTGWQGIPYAGTNEANYLAQQTQDNNFNFADTSWANGMPYAPQRNSVPYMLAAQTQGYSTPNSINFADPSTWQTPSTIPSATPTPQAAAPNKWGYLASAVPGALQTIYGLSQSHQKLPQFHEPNQYANYIEQLRNLSNQGFTPEESNYLNRNIQDTYETGLHNAIQNSGGNSAAVLATLGRLGAATNDAKLKMAAEGAALHRQNLLNYGSGLGTEAQLYNLPQQEWLMKNYLAKQQMANQMVDSGLGNIEGSYFNYLDATDPNRITRNNEIKRIS